MHRPRLLLLLATLALLACGDDDEGPGAGASCTSQGACSSGLVCLAGTCSERAPASLACTPPVAPSRSVGAPVTTPEPPPGTCLTPVRESVAPGTTDLGVHRVGETLTFDVPPNTWSLTIVSQEVERHRRAGHRVPRVPAPEQRRPDRRARAGRPGVLHGHTRSDPGGRAALPRLHRVPRVLRRVHADVGRHDVPERLTRSRLGAQRRQPPGGDVATHGQRLRLRVRRDPGCSGGSALGEYDVRVIRRPGPSPRPARSTSTSTSRPSASTRPGPRRARTSRACSRPSRRCSRTPGSASGRSRSTTCRRGRRRGTGPSRRHGRSVRSLSQLFTLAVEPRPSVHLFLVDELTVSDPDGDFLVVGIDGSIPGPSGVPGTVNGGAIVPLYDSARAPATAPSTSAGCGSDQLGYIAAHEAAHWLGLYHTSERSGTLFDPLSDTPTCACSACAPLLERATCAENEPAGEPLSMTAGSAKSPARAAAARRTSCSGSSTRAARPDRSRRSRAR